MSVSIPCLKAEKRILINYKTKTIDEYRVDLLVYDKIILELKAISELHLRFEAQLLSYLKAAKLKLGMLVNFGTNELYIKRFINPHI